MLKWVKRTFITGLIIFSMMWISIFIWGWKQTEFDSYSLHSASVGFLQDFAFLGALSVFSLVLCLIVMKNMGLSNDQSARIYVAGFLLASGCMTYVMKDLTAILLFQLPHVVVILFYIALSYLIGKIRWQNSHEEGGDIE